MAVARNTANMVANAVSAAVARAGPANAPSAGRRRRRANRRRRIRQNMRDAYRIVNKISKEEGISGNIPGLAPQMGMAAPNENYEPSMPAFTGNAALPQMGLLGSTLAGQRWALKALHPNGEGVTASTGIPDHTHVPVTTPEYRINLVVSKPDGVGANDNWDMDLLFLGTPDLAFLYRTYKSGTTPSDGAWQASYYSASNIRTNVYQALGWSDDGAAKRFEFNVRAGSSGVNYPKARGMYAGITITHDAPALADQGRIVAAQLPLAEPPRQANVELQLTDKNWQYVDTRVVDLGSIPYTEDELFQTSPGAVVWEAREGVYVPLRFNEPVHNFANLIAGNVSGTTGKGTDVPTILAMLREKDQKLVSFRDESAPSPQQINYGTEGVFNFLSAVILFRGVSGYANLSIKARMGMEAQIERGSAVSPFQHASPGLDRAAIDAVTEVSQRSAMAYPASYNNTNGLVNVIRNVLSGLGGVGRFVGGLGIPIVSDVGGTVGSVLGGLGFAPRRRKRRLAAALRAYR